MMRKFCIRLACAVIALALRVRYRISYIGLEEVCQAIDQKAGQGAGSGVLFLPNHPAAIIDPLITASAILKRFPLRPLVTEYMYFSPAFYWAMRIIRALPMPSFTTGVNPLKRKRMEKALSSMSKGLKQGECFLVYPAGMTKPTARETIGGAFGVHQLISENPQAHLVFVRMTGLWGSMFSRALTNGEAPDGQACTKKAFWSVLKNGLFFLPKREVRVEFLLAPKDFPREGSRIEINRYLESWYNSPFMPTGEEPLRRISYVFWREDLAPMQEAPKEAAEGGAIDPEMRRKVIEKVAALANVEPSTISGSMNLSANLGLDSLNFAELLAFMEDEFGVEPVSPGEIPTVNTLFELAAGRLKKREIVEHKWNMHAWDAKRPHTAVFLPEGETIPELFFRTASQHSFRAACADPASGVLSYHQVKKRVLLLSRKIASLPGARVGILLPASATTTILILACQLAGRTPVMINWTVGGRHLDAVVETSGIQMVLTSWTFLDQLENVDLSRIEDMLVILEEMRPTIPLSDVLAASVEAWYSPEQLLKKSAYRHLRARGSEQEAVILFTSGTESMPKGVPLTHNNIISNLRGTLQSLPLYQDDALLSMLPPFHSFGFSLTGLLPLVSGLPVVYYPSPTDSKRLARAIVRWKSTILCSAPTFLKNILVAAQGLDLKMLRLVVSGAEKAPQELFDLIAKRCSAATPCEGYGITECSPVLTVNASGLQKEGVGKPIPCVRMMVVKPEQPTSALAVGETGLLIASGPSIFRGYLGHTASNPFVEIAGEPWYQTGDLGHIDGDGNVIISGRLKRFVKFGGEMVSLAAIEKAISDHLAGDHLAGDHLAKDKQGASCAVGVSPNAADRPKLVLFSIASLTLAEVNSLLRASGFSNLVKIERVVQLPEIPLTGTGKVAYRALDKMLQEEMP